MFDLVHNSSSQQTHLYTTGIVGYKPWSCKTNFTYFTVAVCKVWFTWFAGVQINWWFCFLSKGSLFLQRIAFQSVLYKQSVVWHTHGPTARIPNCSVSSRSSQACQICHLIKYRLKIHNKGTKGDTFIYICKKDAMIWMCVQTWQVFLD